MSKSGDDSKFMIPKLPGISSIRTIVGKVLRIDSKDDDSILKAPNRTWGEIATPYLKIGDPGQDVNIPDPWFVAPSVSGSCDVIISVRNEGTATSYYTVIELLEGPPQAVTNNDIDDCELRDRKIITLHPGQEKKITLKYTRKYAAGQAIGICYDPTFDPKVFENGIGFGFIDRKNISHAVRYYS